MARQAGQLIKRGDKKFLLRIYLGTDPDTGKRRYLNKTVYMSKKEAQKLLTQMLSQRDLGTLVEPERISVNGYLDRWLESSARPRVRETTLGDYTKMLQHYIRPTLGGKELGKLQPFEIQSTYSGLLTRGLSSRTIQYAHSVFKDALNQAVRWRMLQTNPANYVDLPRQQKVADIIVMSDDEAQRFLAVSRESAYQALFALLLATGLRPSEALGLKWADVDFSRLELRVQRKLTRPKNGVAWRLEPTKTKASKRVVTFPAQLAETLMTYRERQVYTTEDLVFTDASGEPGNGYNILRREFRPLLPLCGLDPRMRLYDLRHTHATLLLLTGVHPKTVSERLGHSSVKITLDTYSHVLPSLQKHASDAIGGLLFKAEEDEEDSDRVTN